MIEHTLCIIKPNAIKKNILGKIINRFELANLSIISMKMLKLYREQAVGFYFEHKNKSFFNMLIDFMISGPILVFILEGEDAIKNTRSLIGTTDPRHAKIGTIRSDYGDNLTENTIHSSASKEEANREIAYFFTANEIYSHIL
ncbi:nucleoside-diphosphate kinase [Candidatus Schneideria nysicola]|uniref:nucleoside-diphosphate kinase n=1 Tax=Candidatus Schneideria nysicola TaxID=1081631 RepID=UPI001CAA448A|nr:nucleoside-diphosphate kinase [Candidatus Schneideria nysicola]UAJ64962.1 nucleoside-diphosphate kinase [Candidatus Schneideria nysicola]